MASASIESTVTAPVAKPTVTDASRDDLEVSDVVEVNSVNFGTAYAWSLAYAPEGSAAAFSGSVLDQSPGTFTVDREGPYLIRLSLTIPTVSVLSGTIPAGATLTINGVALTAVAGARTSGANDFNGSLGTAALVAAEIVAALNDGANAFTAIVVPTVAVGSSVLNLDPASSGLSLTVTSSTPLLTPNVAAASEQFVRLRALTAFGSLKLVAAGERVDTVPVPVDITITGWADEQNFNLLTLLSFLSAVTASGNVVYVDPVDGDYTTIQAAMDAANAASPTAASPWVVLVRPSTYVEDLTFYPFVHLFAWPGGQSTGLVRVQNATVASHTINLPLSTDEIALSNLYFEQTAATSNPMILIDGAGSVVAHKSVFLAEGAGAPQGPAVQVDPSASFDAFDCRFGSNAGASSGTVSILAGTGSTVTLRDSRVLTRGVQADEGATVILRDVEVNSAGDYGIFSQASTLIVEYTSVDGGTTASLGLNPAGAAVGGSVSAQVRWSRIGDLVFDVTGVAGTTTLDLGSTEHGALSFPGGAPTTLSASTPADTLFYDNTTSSLVAENVQDALDEIYSFAQAVRTLDDAYDGGDPGPTGSGRTIVADSGAVQIVDASAPSDPIPPDNTNGGLDVVGRIRIGAIDKPEMVFDPNPFGNGPSLLLGREIWANDAPSGSTALVLADATGTPTYHNYNLTVGTKSADGGSGIGRVSVRAGDSLVNTLDGGDLYVQPGNATDGAGGDGGSLFLSYGSSTAGTAGSIFMARPDDATPATLTAAGAFVGGVAGLERFATDQGAIEVNILVGDLLGDVLAKFNATGVVTAVDSGGGVIQLSTVSTGPTAEVFFLNADTGLDTALGVFSGQAMVAGTWPSTVEIQVNGPDSITFGPNSGTPFTYDGPAGKITFAGIIDPTAVVFDLFAPIDPGLTKGVIFVGDGSGGTTIGDFYYRYESGPLQNISSAVSGSTTIVVENAAVGIGSFGTLNFTGSGVVASDAGGGTADITVTASSPLTTQDEGVNVEVDTTLINFVGAGVTASLTAPNQIEVSVPGGGVLTAVSQENWLASTFVFGGGVSSITLTDTLDTTATLQGLIVLYRNGAADMNNVGPALPSSATEYRINGTDLEIGVDVTGTADRYRLVYPSV